MKYIKGILLGAIASIVASIAYLIISLIVVEHNTPKGVELGFDLRTMFVTPRSWTIGFWLTTVAAFALGFWRKARPST